MRISMAFVLALGAVLSPGVDEAWGQMKKRSALYASVGRELSWYAVDVEGAALNKGGSVMLPQNVQEAWPHPSGRFLYVTWASNGGGKGGQHGVTAFKIDSATGALQQHGQPISLAARSVFITVDGKGQYLVVAYNLPSGATVHRIAANGTLGAPVPQPQGLDFGVYAHQVRVDPTSSMVVVVTRGNGPTAKTAEDPGALKVYGFKDGVLSNRASIAPGGGYNFQPRHLEFHPAQPFAFITLERQNKVQVYRVAAGPTLNPAPLFTKNATQKGVQLPAQTTSAIHAHPNGKFLYVGNRGLDRVEFKGKQVIGDGVNSISVYSINQSTGEPAMIQDADTHGIHPRTFTLDPTGRLLVVANLEGGMVRDKDQVREVAANLAVFRIREDGKLDFVRKYDQDTSGGRSVFWTGIVGLP